MTWRLAPWAAAWFLLLMQVVHPARANYETWHLVDVPAVVCPLPTGGNCSEDLCGPVPATGENYAVAIEKDPGRMSLGAPHVLSFLRTSDQAVTISYEVKDADGVLIGQRTTLNLEGFDDIQKPDTCVCNQEQPPPLQSPYQANYGYGCSNWDNDNCNLKNPDLTVGQWCCDHWCYADESCPDALPSSHTSSDGLPLYFSYLVCNPQPEATATCSWVGQAPLGACDCRSVEMNAENTQKYGENYGSVCRNWDAEDCHLKYTEDQLDTWCCERWCYVSSDCSAAQPSIIEDGLFWATLGVCENDPEDAAQCPYQPVVEVDTNVYEACRCKEESKPTTVSPTDAPSAYGSSCAAWDQYDCENYYPGAFYDMWCCDTWCYVDATCPTAQQSLYWSGHYFSTTGCLDPPAQDDDPPVYAYSQAAATSYSYCSYSDACKCLTPGPDMSQSYADGLAHAASLYGPNYGVNCSAHDAQNCSGFWSGSDYWDGGNNDWCCDSWCYVSFDCPIADPSALGDAVPPFSYDNCVDDGPQTYNEASNGCENSQNRRLSAHDESSGASLRAERRVQATQPRRLAARRRSGSPRRRRAPPRRRNPPPPPEADARRRRSSSPRRRTPSSYTAPAQPTRRRYTPPRRRAGTSDARRRAESVTAPRRRGMPPPPMYDNSPYGYSNQNYMYSNYGGMPPYTTSYGYSGHNAYQSGSTANMAMYAAGGAVAGAALGAGAYYMYMNRYESPEWDWMRRRRYWWYNRDETQWCLEPEPPKRLMECDECFARYDSCLRTSSCYESSGCTYVTGNNYNRDDLEGVVFAPDNVKWPISVHIYSIAGPGIVTQGINSICPPQTKEEYDWCVEYNKINSFNPDLFVTITEMDILGDNNIDSANAIAGLWMSALLACFSIGCRP